MKQIKSRQCHIGQLTLLLSIHVVCGKMNKVTDVNLIGNKLVIFCWLCFLKFRQILTVFNHFFKRFERRPSQDCVGYQPPGGATVEKILLFLSYLQANLFEILVVGQGRPQLSCHQVALRSTTMGCYWRVKRDVSQLSVGQFD